jgi:hypothetical protein
MDVTVILNGYKRPHSLIEQYNAIKNQTYNNINIMLWSNYDKDSFDKYPEHVIAQCASAFCNANFGVWARFAFAWNAYTKYICIMDDDTIPGSKWIENCVKTMQTNIGLLGCRGVRMKDDGYENYPGCKYESICGGNDKLEMVDIIGHCWFFEREWLRAYWLESPSSALRYGGEDIHFSYAIQKHYGLNSYIPPQPSNDKEMWGSTDPSKYGEDMAATSRTSIGHTQANAYWNYILQQGYKLVKDRK